MSAGGENISVVFDIFLNCGLKYDESRPMDILSTAFGLVGYPFPNSRQAEEEVRNLLRYFVSKMETDGISHYGFRAGAGPCNIRWGILSILLDEILPNAIFISTMKRPAGDYKNKTGQVSANEFTLGYWMNVIGCRREVILKGGYVLPIPLVFKEHRLQKIVEFFGLEWSDAAEGLLATTKHDELLTAPIGNSCIETEFNWICKETEYNFMMNGLKINLT